MEMKVRFGEQKNIAAEISQKRNIRVSMGMGVAEVATSDHNKLVNRDMEKQHPIQSIEGLSERLDSMRYSPLTNEEIEQIINGFS